MGKHVIFLGAGASKASGYPLASELRLLLSSERHFLDWVTKWFPPYVVDQAKEYFKSFAPAITLFREGGFASVDEFCRLVSGGQNSNAVGHMRLMTRAVLGAANPEDKFQESEYYAFVQKLFKPDLANLRDDVSILSFNYDPYLEFLIYRAWTARNENKLPYTDVGNSITSGFLGRDDYTWAESEKPRLYLLKLQGSICEFIGKEPWLRTYSFYTQSAVARAKAIFDLKNTHVPPIIFPWELLDENLNFIKKQDFPIQNDQYDYDLFTHIWQRARKEVQDAEKISFVGLSLHEYMKLGFRYLFQGKKREVQCVVANKLNKHFQQDRAEVRPHPNSPCQRAGALIEEVTQGRTLCRYSVQDIGHASFAPENRQQCVTSRESFGDFIEHEL
jgi:hypothetical protein